MQVSKGIEIPVDVVGSSTFGRYPTISLSQTYNMYITDNWMCNYAGFARQVNLLQGGIGRGLFNSIRGGFMISVISSSVFRLSAELNQIFIGNIQSTQGAVFIDENLANQICIVDGQSAYIYNYIDNTLTRQTLTIPAALATPSFVMIPGYVCYHNTFFLFGSSPSSPFPQTWAAFVPATADTIVFNTGSAFLLQTKPDVALMVKRLPGKGNNVIVLGSTVAEVWTQVGGIENYRRIQSFNIDNGIVSVSTLAANDEYVCWLSQNESNSPSIMVTDGGKTDKISSDGIDYLLSTLIHPEQSTAFFYRQDGHLFYQLTFYNNEDNLTLIYDFTTQKFFHASDENLNYYPARKNIFFDEAIYFVSINDGGLYIMDTNFLTYNYGTAPGNEIPRIRICNTIRKPNSDRFRVGQFTFTMEQGVLSSPPIEPSRVDMTISKNGALSFGNVVSRPLNFPGRYQNQIIWERLGQANAFTIKLSFVGFQRFIVAGGVAECF
jgi:hypothetical protein